MSIATKPRTKDESFLTRERSDERRLRAKPRRAGLLAASALFIVGSALAGGYLFTVARGTDEVLAVREPVARGHTVERSNLLVRNVAGVPDVIRSSAIDSVVGKVALTDLVAGQVLTGGSLTGSPMPGAGKASVGLSLPPSRVPTSGLDAGDIIDLVAVPAASSGSSDKIETPTRLADRALVYAVKGSAADGGTVMVTVIVAESDAPRVAAYSNAERVALVETSAGGG